MYYMPSMHKENKMSDPAKTKSIYVRIETYEKLLRRKVHPRQSFGDVIEELIANGRK